MGFVYRRSLPPRAPLSNNTHYSMSNEDLYVNRKHISLATAIVYVSNISIASKA